MNQTHDAPPIGREEIRSALDTLRRYKAGKLNLERRIIENEEFWKLRHWNHIPEQGTTGLKTKSAWLVNVLLSKHADAMDAYPEPACLPRAADDETEARLLSKVIPVILAQNDFAGVWSDNWWKKLKAGVAIYGVFWDREKNGGLGDVSITRVDPLNLFWEPGITDLQRSRNLFHVELADNDELTERYPSLDGKLRASGFPYSRYLYDDTVDTSGKSPVIDWYYKKREGRRTVLHYVKFVGETVLFSTENDPAYADGLYSHGLYPFFADVLFPEEGTPAGFGYVDLCKDAQRQIDLMNNAIVANCVAAATPRWLKRGEDGINEEEYADWTKPFVHVQGSLEENALRPITVSPLSGNCLSILASKRTLITAFRGYLNRPAGHRLFGLYRLYLDRGRAGACQGHPSADRRPARRHRRDQGHGQGRGAEAARQAEGPGAAGEIPGLLRAPGDGKHRPGRVRRHPGGLDGVTQLTIDR